MKFQIEGIGFALTHPRCLLAHEMGLGKTIMAIGVVNANDRIRDVLIVSPASLRLNCLYEWQRWSTRKDLLVAVADGAGWPDSDVVIISYEGLAKYFDEIHGHDWDLVIADECHKLKNDRARRTINLLGKRLWNSYERRWVQEVPPVQADRLLFITGTPLLNRPAELWTIVHALDPDGLGRSKSYFEEHYCGAHWGWRGYNHIWNKDGASNLAELNERMSRFMIRRTKAEVLDQLPPKRHQIIVLETPPGLRKLLNDEKQEYEKLEEAQLRGVRVPFNRMSSIRQQVALAKVPFVVGHIKETLESVNKLVVMAHHREVIDRIANEFKDMVEVVDGRTPTDQRQEAVERFQRDPQCKVFLCSIQTGGFGFNLTAANIVLFSELDWVPGNLLQAEDRLHRIGQENPVLVQHVVLDGSLDANLVHKVIAKQRIIGKVLNGAA